MAAPPATAAHRTSEPLYRRGANIINVYKLTVSLLPTVEWRLFFGFFGSFEGEKCLSGFIFVQKRIGGVDRFFCLCQWFVLWFMLLFSIG